MLYNGSLFGPEHPEHGYIFWTPSDDVIEMWTVSFQYAPKVDLSEREPEDIIRIQGKEELSQHFGLMLRRTLGTAVRRREYGHAKNPLIYQDASYEKDVKELVTERFMKYSSEPDKISFLSSLARELIDSVKTTPDHWNPMGLFYDDETGNLIARR